MAPPPSYLIIGAGCFGASTARALKQTHPDADVVLLDPSPFPNPAAAGHGIFRQFIDHADPSLGTFAQRFWYDFTYWGGPGSPVGTAGGRGND